MMFVLVVMFSVLRLNIVRVKNLMVVNIVVRIVEIFVDLGLWGFGVVEFVIIL